MGSPNIAESERIREEQAHAPAGDSSASGRNRRELVRQRSDSLRVGPIGLRRAIDVQREREAKLTPHQSVQVRVCANCGATSVSMDDSDRSRLGTSWSPAVRSPACIGSHEAVAVYVVKR